MKKLLIVALLINAALLAGRFWQEMPVNAQVAGDPACQSDRTLHSIDSNDDGIVNLSDAVHLLTWLFSGGPEPQACLASDGGSGLPDTGQTTCYDVDGNEIPCDGANCPGQDGLYQTGCGPADRFIDNADGTVTDRCTGLMWQRETADTDGDGGIGDADAVNWCEALAYCGKLTWFFTAQSHANLPCLRPALL